MRIFTRTTKVLGLAKHELDALSDMLREARETGKAERQMSSTEVLAIEISDMYGHRTRDGDPATHMKGH